MFRGLCFIYPTSCSWKDLSTFHFSFNIYIPGRKDGLFLKISGKTGGKANSGLEWDKHRLGLAPLPVVPKSAVHMTQGGRVPYPSHPEPTHEAPLTSLSCHEQWVETREVEGREAHRAHVGTPGVTF